MTAPLRSTPHSQLPTSQAAPVAEFRCLYTPDIRKKQKKWQDGYLEFHSFNNRVMVYDQARNFLGDTYYKDSNELHEGDELTLDKGVMVEVADAMGVTQTDLTPLFEKKPKDAHPLPSAPPRRFQPPSQVTRLQAVTSNNSNVRTNSQLRHKSLNTLLGTPKGPIGKSVPIRSPYEARQEKEKENGFVVDRALKRRKTAHSSTSSATLRLSSPAQEEIPAPKKTLSLGAKTSDARRPHKPAEPIPQGAPVIILDELDPVAHISPDASLPSTPPQIVEVPASLVITPAPPVNFVGTKKPVLQTPKIPRGKVPVPSVKALETPKVQAPTSSPPVSASNRLTNVEFAIQLTPAKEPFENPSTQLLPPQLPQSAPRNPRAKTLRLSAGMKRGTLMMCQPPPPPRAKGISKGRMAATTLETAETSNTVKRANSEQVSAGRHLDASNDDQEGFHGSMDQQLVVTPVLPASLPGSSSRPKLVPDKPVQAIPRSKAERNTVRDVRKTSPIKAKESETAKTTIPLVQTTEALEPGRKLVQKPQSACKASPGVTPVAKSPKLHGRAASPTLSAVSEARPRIASTSPQKLAALSTDDLRRNLKRATPQPTSPLGDLLAAPYSETILLQSHSLHGNKKAPVMTTTELAAMLQKPKKKTNVPLDFIKNSEATSDKGSDRKFKRVLRENDAPIPSTSEDWEKKNLLKFTPKTTGAVPTEAAEEPKAPTAAAKKNSGLAALVKKTDPRRKLVRTQNLNIDTDVPPAQDVVSPTVSPIADTDIGPWSTEAFDLFDWRPPRIADVET